MNQDINIFLETLLYPMIDLKLLTKGNRELDSGDTKEVNRANMETRRMFIDYIIDKHQIKSYDMIHLYIKKWYPKCNTNNKRDSYFDEVFYNLRKLSENLISLRDGKIVYKYWETQDTDEFLQGFKGKNKINLFHSLNKAIPLDILPIIYLVENEHKIQCLDGYFSNIAVKDRYLDKILESGIAENHLHSGVSETFSRIWDNITDIISKRSIKLIKDKLFYDRTASAMEKKYLLLATYLKMFLFKYVINKNENKEIDLGDVEDTIKYICGDEESAPKEEEIESDLINKWEQLFKSGMPTFKGYVENIRDENGERIDTSFENIFLFKVMEFLFKENNLCSICENKNKGKEIYMFEEIFLNYIRIKNTFYRNMVQRKSISGLDYFQEKYNRASTATDINAEILGESKWRRAIKEQLQMEHISHLELRASVKNETKFNKEFKSFLKSYREILREDFCKKENKEYTPFRKFPKVGLVFHFLKKEQDNTNNCIKDKKFAYYKLYKEYKAQIETIKTLRAKSYILSKYMLGIDVASLENAVPTWVYREIFEDARDGKYEIINYGKNYEKAYNSLNFTFHCGEDFRDTISGLRRVYEVVEYLKFHAGDRIGHGIALGIDIDEWYRDNQTVITTKIEALQNYIWAYDMLKDSGDADAFNNISYVKNKVYELFSQIYMEDNEMKTSVNIDLILDAYKGLYKGKHFSDMENKEKCNIIDKECKNCEYLKMKEPIHWTYDKIISAMHCKYFAEKMEEPIHFEIPDIHINIAKYLQSKCRRKVNEKGIIVEINPSSNVTISQIDTLDKSHIYTLNSYENKEENIIVCINSDDPCVFNTNVENEIGYIYFSLISKGIGREIALKWIEKIVKNGLSASFIDYKVEDSKILEELEKVLNII